MRHNKIHLREGTCKHGERGSFASHRRFVDADNKACLACARICSCTECYGLMRAFGQARRAAGRRKKQA